MVLNNQPQPKCSDKSALLPPPNPAPAAVASISSKILQLLSLKLLIFFWMTDKTKSKYTLVPAEMLAVTIYIIVILQKLPHNDRHVHTFYI